MNDVLDEINEALSFHVETTPTTFFFWQLETVASLVCWDMRVKAGSLLTFFFHQSVNVKSAMKPEVNLCDLSEFIIILVCLYIIMSTYVACTETDR